MRKSIQLGHDHDYFAGTLWDLFSVLLLVFLRKLPGTAQ